MIYFLYGTDTKKSRMKLHEMLDSLSKKRPNSEIFKITSENFTESWLDELLTSQGLFDAKYIVVLDGLFDKKERKDFLFEKLQNLKESQHPFLIIEGKVDANTLKKVEKFSEKSQEFSKPEEKEDLNIFSVANGLVQKDKKSLWVDLVSFLSKGIPAEEIHGIFFWQVKNMILAGKSGPEDSGLSPFVYRNALSGGRNYKSEELQKMSGELVDMTHRVRQGEGDLEIMLEKWVLGL